MTIYQSCDILVITFVINKKFYILFKTPIQSWFRLEFHYHITRNLEVYLKLNLSHLPGLAASRECLAGTSMHLASVLVNLEL